MYSRFAEMPTITCYKMKNIQLSELLDAGAIFAGKNSIMNCRFEVYSRVGNHERIHSSSLFPILCFVFFITTSSRSFVIYVSDRLPRKIG